MHKTKVEKFLNVAKTWIDISSIGFVTLDFCFNHRATLSISKSFLQDTLEFSLNGLVGLHDFDSALTFEEKYSLSDQIKLSAFTRFAKKMIFLQICDFLLDILFGKMYIIGTLHSPIV